MKPFNPYAQEVKLFDKNGKVKRHRHLWYKHGRAIEDKRPVYICSYCRGQKHRGQIIVWDRSGNIQTQIPRTKW